MLDSGKKRLMENGRDNLILEAGFGKILDTLRKRLIEIDRDWKRLMVRESMSYLKSLISLIFFHSCIEAFLHSRIILNVNQKKSLWRH